MTEPAVKAIGSMPGGNVGSMRLASNSGMHPRFDRPEFSEICFSVGGEGRKRRGRWLGNDLCNK